MLSNAKAVQWYGYAKIRLSNASVIQGLIAQKGLKVKANAKQC